MFPVTEEAQSKTNDMHAAKNPVIAYYRCWLCKLLKHPEK